MAKFFQQWRRQTLLSILLVPAALALSISESAAQTYPTKPVKIVVPSAPGGGTDIIGRLLAKAFSSAFGQNFYVENKPGAGNLIGIESVARAPADGYTLLFAACLLSAGAFSDRIGARRAFAIGGNRGH